MATLEPEGAEKLRMDVPVAPRRLSSTSDSMTNASQPAAKYRT